MSKPLFCITETENIGKAHINAAHRMLEELDKSLKDFREQQRELRKKVCPYFIIQCGMFVCTKYYSAIYWYV